MNPTSRGARLTLAASLVTFPLRAQQDTAALYGSEAAGGVLLVTTKRDAPGPVRLHGYTTQGLSHDPHLFPVNFATGPSGVLTNDPLGDPAKSPFRTGYLRGYGADAAAG